MKIEKSIDVEVPVSTAYNQWTQFEEFPSFMEGVRSIRQTDDTHLDWDVEIAGQERSFTTEITEQTPDERIAWTTRTGPTQAGVVTFHRLDEGQTRVMLQMEFEPEGLIEQAGDKLGLIEGRVEGDLRRFKTFIEAMGSETGAWRGEVDRPQDSPVR